ncbi:Di-sulfide bridge nucleocytoplasmic transport domain-containing protein [Blakeslea trispora]|nr:Di-sulfide bridge nucleocytoplasmic transport domain-containing protein [Blakeslea trispora]
MDDSYPDPMDFEYTNLNSLFGHAIPNKSFQVSSSLLEEVKSKKSLTNTVCNLLDNFSLSEEPQEHEIKTLPLEKTPPVDSQATPPESPKSSNALVPIQHVSAQAAPLSPQTTHLTCPVDQTNIPSSYSYSPTFIFNATPTSQALTSTSEHQKGKIVYLTGLFKLSLLSVIFSGVIYIAFQIISFIRHDMKVKADSFESDLLADQLYCQYQYDINRCAPHTRLPAVQNLCREWEQCMYRPMYVSKSQILAETLASMLNAFVNTLSLKSLVYEILIVLLLIWSVTHLLKGKIASSKA